MYRIVLVNKKTGQDIVRDYDLDAILETSDSTFGLGASLLDMKNTLDDNSEKF